MGNAAGGHFQVAGTLFQGGDIQIAVVIKLFHQNGTAPGHIVNCQRGQFQLPFRQQHCLRRFRIIEFLTKDIARLQIDHRIGEGFFTGIVNGREIHHTVYFKVPFHDNDFAGIDLFSIPPEDLRHTGTNSG